MTINQDKYYIGLITLTGTIVLDHGFHCSADALDLQKQYELLSPFDIYQGSDLLVEPILPIPLPKSFAQEV